jgi:hypothetical protein
MGAWRLRSDSRSSRRFLPSDRPTWFARRQGARLKYYRRHRHQPLRAFRFKTLGLLASIGQPAQEFITHKFWIGRSPPVVICRRDRNGCFVINCRSPLSCPQPLSIFLVSIASLPFSIFPLFSSTRSDGRVAEWSNVPDSKSGDRAIGPWVRIPPLPLSLKELR